MKRYVQVPGQFLGDTEQTRNFSSFEHIELTRKFSYYGDTEQTRNFSSFEDIELTRKFSYYGDTEQTRNKMFATHFALLG